MVFIHFAINKKARIECNSRFPDLFDRFNDLTDTRKHMEYPMAKILSGALFMYIFKETSRKSFMAMQNYYHLLQIAHLINQLAERTKQVAAILREHSKQTIVDLWKKMMAYLTILLDTQFIV